MKKRILAILLCMVMVFASMPRTIFAQTGNSYSDVTFTATVDKPVVEKSDQPQTVTVTIQASREIEVTGINADLPIPNTFDEEMRWTITSISNTDVTFVRGDYILRLNKSGIGRICYETAESEFEALQNIGVVVYTIPANAEVGTYTLGAENIEITGRKGTQTNVPVIQGASTPPVTVTIVDGHDWKDPTWVWDGFTSATATFVCNNDETHVENKPADSITYEDTTPATCEAPGERTYTATVAFNGNTYTNVNTEKEVLQALGHDYKLSEWIWAADKSSATARFVCTHDASHVIEVTDSEIEVEHGIKETTYTASVEFEGKPYENVQSEDEFKFRVRVSSDANDGTVGSVTGTVYSDYSADLIFVGEHVNRSNATIDLWMRNVASLGVTGERHYGRTVNTGLNGYGDNDLDMVRSMFVFEDGTTITGTVKNDNKTVVYTVENDDEGNVLATPDETANARAVWMAIVANVTSGTKSEDSYIKIANGSWLQVGGKRLQFEADAEDFLTLDDFSDLEAMETLIRDTVELVPAEKPVTILEAYLEAGTELAVGSSYAKLDKDAKITVDIAGYSEAELLELLEELQGENVGTGALIQGALGMILTVTSNMSGVNTDVVFEFDHVWETPTYEWKQVGDNYEVTATALCRNNPEHKLTETVTASAEVTKPATCEAKGETTYTATFTNELFETQIKTYEDVDALGHDYKLSEWIWAADKSSATARFVCTHDASHVIEVTDSEIEVEHGIKETTYTASVEFEGKPYENVQSEDEFKFRVRVSSDANDGTVGSVTGTVYSDYSADLIFVGEHVNRSNATIDLWMRNVASLGVTGERHYGRTVNTGLNGYGDNDLDMVRSMFVFDDGTTITGTVKNDNKTVVYTVENDDEGNVLATPDETANARAVWMAIVANVTSGTKSEDSYIKIANGSWLRVGGKRLQFEADAEDFLTLDDFSDLEAMETLIRDTVELVPAEKPVTILEAYLEAGTELAVGSSYAKLDKDAKITVDIAGYEEAELLELLEELQGENVGTGALIQGALGMILTVTSNMSGVNTDVVFEFDHVWETPTYEWKQVGEGYEVTATALCRNNPEHKLTETVTASAEEVKAATCTEAGDTKYTATFKNELFETQTQTVEGDIPALGHLWPEPEAVEDNPHWEWSEDFTSATATFTCLRAGCTHTETMTDNEIETKDIEGGYEATASVIFNGKEYSVTTFIAARNIIVHPYPEAAFTEVETADDFTASGQYDRDGHKVTVKFNKPCKLGYLSEDGTYFIPLEPTKVEGTEDTYYFVAPDFVEEVTLVVKGNVNMQEDNTDITLADSTMVKSYFNRLATHATLTPEELFAANVVDEYHPEITLADSTRIKSVFNRLATNVTFTWELRND